MKRLMLVVAGVALVGAGTIFVVRIGTAERAPAANVAAKNITIYRSPTCSCCKGYEAYLRSNGFTVTIVEVPDPTTEKVRLGVPKDAWSCHTSVLGGYVVEGHVPIEVIERLLAEKPSVAGIALPGMPNGAPGMETAKDAPLHIVSFDRAGVLSHFATA